jgi:hypothetical protein
LLDLDIAAAADPPSVVENSSEAFRLLRIEAQRAKWKATGIPLDGGLRREILPFEWIDLRIAPVRGAGVQVGHDIRYDECRFPVDGVTKAFPASGVVRGAGKMKSKRERGDFTKVKEAVSAIYLQGIAKELNDSDVAQEVARRLKGVGAKVPTVKTLLKHIAEIRSS